MKDMIKIGSFLLLLLLFTAEDCSDKATDLSYDERQTEMFQHIEYKFEKAQLQPTDLKAFEIRGQQMVSDLVDYMNIYADTSILKNFRLQAKQMIRELFTSDALLDSFFVQLNFVENYEQGTLFFKEKPVKIQLQSAYLTESFTQQTDSSYSGSIQFGLYFPEEKFYRQNELLELQLVKKSKQFGENSVIVWELFFGRK